MISTDEGSLICDLAETYGILDYKSLPVKLLATLASGLRDDARIIQKMSGVKARSLDIMVAHAADELSLIRYGFTDNAQHGRNVPPLFTDVIFGIEKETVGFDTPEEFDAWKLQMQQKGRTDGC